MIVKGELICLRQDSVRNILEMVRVMREQLEEADKYLDLHWNSFNYSQGLEGNFSHNQRTRTEDGGVRCIEIIQNINIRTVLKIRRLVHTGFGLVRNVLISLKMKKSDEI